MDALLYARMLSDKSIIDLKKLGYKYPDADIGEFIELLKVSGYQTIPIPDFSGNNLVYMKSVTQVRMSAVKLLLTPQDPNEPFGLKAMEEEITASLTIENIDTSRDSVRRILRGYAPADANEERIYGMKKGLDFICDPANAITEQTIRELYDTAIGQYLPADDRLQPGAYYRHDSVYVVGQQIEHTGLPYDALAAYMAKLVAFVNAKSEMNDLLKAAAIHFYIAYLHPYFDGNGRMARLLHLWYLKRQGYSSALFIPFSSYIEKDRKGYYNAYSLCEQNARISGIMDITPFLAYFIDHVYHKLETVLPEADILEAFRKALADGAITEKEKDLWNFVLSAYGAGEFSTKQLERDFGNAAYATIRGFAMKFTALGLLTVRQYGNRAKYSIAKK